MSKIIVRDCCAFCPLGTDLDHIRANLQKGHSGIQNVTDPNFQGLSTHHAGLVPKVSLKSFPTSSIQGVKLVSYVLNAVDKLLSTNDLDVAHHRVGVFLGTEPPILDFDREIPILRENFDLEANAWKENIQPYNQAYCGLHPEKLLNEIFTVFKMHGPAFLHLGTCAASSQALGEAAQLLQCGKIDYALAGGVSFKIDPLAFVRLIKIGALAPTNGEASTLSRPFDKKRCGFTMSEGCVLFLLAREEIAKLQRTPLGIIEGYGASLDGFSITDPSDLGMTLAMSQALKSAHLDPSQIDYINAHGTSTVKNDICETQAIKKVFGGSGVPPISSTKSMHGHLMSAAGAMEALVSFIAINNDFIPPTINLTDPDPQCDLDYTPNVARKQSLRHVLSNSFGLGGQNSTLILSKYE